MPPSNEMADFNFWMGWRTDPGWNEVARELRELKHNLARLNQFRKDHRKQDMLRMQYNLNRATVQEQQ